MKLKIIISTILILILVIFLFNNKKDSQSKETINLKSEIIKNDDEAKMIEINNKEIIQIRFSWEVNGIKYNDALNMSKEEYEKFSPEQIDKMKEERFKNWVRTVNEQSKK